MAFPLTRLLAELSDQVHSEPTMEIPFTRLPAELSDHIHLEPTKMAFPFTRLPVEIRYKIYELLLCDHKALVKSPDSWTRLSCNLQPAILRVSRQIHDEARDVLVKKNKFVRLVFEIPQHIHLDYHMKMIKAMIWKRLPIIGASRQALDAFKGYVMTYSFWMPNNPETPEDFGSMFVTFGCEADDDFRPMVLRFDCMMLHRDLDLLYESLVKLRIDAGRSGLEIKHSITLHDPLEDPAKPYPSKEQQKHLLAPLSKPCGLTLVNIRGKVDASMATDVLTLMKTNPENHNDIILKDMQDRVERFWEYAKNRKHDFCLSTAWADVMERMALLCAPRHKLAIPEPFDDNLAEMWFVLHISKVTLHIDRLQRVQMALGDSVTTRDMSPLLNSALSEVQDAFNPPNFDRADWEWHADNLKVALLYSLKAKIHRLGGYYSGAVQAIQVAEGANPDDALVKQERQKIDQMRTA